jgi:cysteine desulfurase
VTGVAGFVAAAELAVAEMAAEAVRLEGLRERLSEGIQGALPEAVRNSPRRGCLPHILSFSFPGLNAKKIIQALDLEGVYVSAGAACGSASEDPSHVLLAIGRTPELALGAVRFSLGRQTTRPQIDRAIAATVRAVRRARAG